MRNHRHTALLIIFAVLALVLGACASTGGGSAPAAPPPPSDEDVIKEQIIGALEALKTGDVDTMLAGYADDFSSDQGFDKSGMQQFLQGAKDQGFLDGLSYDASGLSVTVDGDTANASGITLEGAFGVLDMGFGLAKRDGRWVVVSQTQQ